MPVSRHARGRQLQRQRQPQAVARQLQEPRRHQATRQQMLGSYLSPIGSTRTLSAEQAVAESRGGLAGGLGSPGLGGGGGKLLQRTDTNQVFRSAFS